MGLLKFNRMDGEHQKMLADILCSTFDNRYTPEIKEKIVTLGKLVGGENFQLLPRFSEESGFSKEKTEGVNYLGEVMQILRQAQVPISFVGKLAISHLGFVEDSPYAKAMNEVVARVEEDTTKRIEENNVNPYHNESHEINVLVASMAIGKGEGISDVNRALNAIVCAFHDHGHDSLQNEHDSVKDKAPDRLERLALKLMGLEETPEDIQIAPDSPLRHLSKMEIKNVFQRVIDTVFPTKSFHVRNRYQAGPVNEDLSARACIVAADLAESRTLAGNLGNAMACYRELAFSASRSQNPESVRQMFMGMLSSIKRIHFLKVFAFPYTKGEKAIGLTEENNQLAHHLDKKEEPTRKFYDIGKYTSDLVTKAKKAVGWAI